MGVFNAAEEIYVPEVGGQRAECDKQESKVISDKMSYTVGGILNPHLSALNYL